MTFPLRSLVSGEVTGSWFTFRLHRANLCQRAVQRLQQPVHVAVVVVVGDADADHAVLWRETQGLDAATAPEVAIADGDLLAIERQRDVRRPSARHCEGNRGGAVTVGHAPAADDARVIARAQVVQDTLAK